jgi:tRNA C32,U32 (ribose-2'-O)-methylase TrmJ
MIVSTVLVRTENPANIGSSFRAVCNMGGDRMVLVAPEKPMNDQSKMLAAGVSEKLSEVTSYSSWNDFYAAEGEGLRIAFTRRSGRKRPVVPFTNILNSLKRRPRHLYLYFGPESDGLNAEDLSFANHLCHLPVFGSFGSLNLSQAVLLALYLVRERFPIKGKTMAQTLGPEPEAVAPMYFPDQLIKDWLTAMGFNIKARKASAYLTLRDLFLVKMPTRHQIQVLEAILQQNIRKLRQQAR